MAALLELILTALFEYIDHLYKFFKRVHVPPAHPSLNDERTINYCAVLLITIVAKLNSEFGNSKVQILQGVS